MPCQSVVNGFSPTFSLFCMHACTKRWKGLKPKLSPHVHCTPSLFSTFNYGQFFHQYCTENICSPNSATLYQLLLYSPFNAPMHILETRLSAYASFRISVAAWLSIASHLLPHPRETENRYFKIVGSLKICLQQLHTAGWFETPSKHSLFFVLSFTLFPLYRSIFASTVSCIHARSVYRKLVSGHV